MTNPHDLGAALFLAAVCWFAVFILGSHKQTLRRGEKEIRILLLFTFGFFAMSFSLYALIQLTMG